MRHATKYLLLVAPATLMIAVFFLWPLGFSLISAFTRDTHHLTLMHFAKVLTLYSNDILFTVVIVLASLAILLLLSITLSAVIVLSPYRRIVKALAFFIPLAAVYSFYCYRANDADVSGEKRPDE